MVSLLTVAVDISRLDVCGAPGFISVPMLIQVIQKRLQDTVKHLGWSLLDVWQGFEYASVFC